MTAVGRQVGQQAMSGSTSGGRAATTSASPAGRPRSPVTTAPASRGHQPAGGQVPRLQALLVVAVHPAGREGAQVERGRARPAGRRATCGSTTCEDLGLPGPAARP